MNMNNNRVVISIGLAIFAMLFGAGNVVWPLVLGRDVGDKVWFGLLGFILVGVLVPLVGLISTMLCDGEYKKLLLRLGKAPAALISLLCMIMIGPFMGIPRCITLSHASVKLYVPQFTLLLYSLFAVFLIFIATIRKSKVVDLLGNYLGPIKLALLLILIVVGLLQFGTFVPTTITPWEGFLQGVDNGALTGDLLGTIFFSSLIFYNVKAGMGDDFTYKKLAVIGLKAGVIGAFLLGLVYAGFCIIAAFNGAQLVGIERGDVFSHLAGIVLGQLGGIFANVTIAVSTITTAIALTTVFATYLHQEILYERVSYLTALLITSGLSIAISNIGFEGIAVFAGVVFMAIYPALIVLAIANVAYVFWGFQWTRTSVFITFAATMYMQYWPTVLTLLQ